MKILIISQHFFPDNFRINDIASELVNRGHDVTVITSLPDYANGYVPEEYKEKFVDEYNGVKVFRIKVHERRSGVKNRALNYFSFLRNSTKFIKKNIVDFDIIFSYQTSPVMMAHAAVKAKKKLKKKLVLYCLDLWPESLKAWGVKESNPLFKIMHKYSKWVYKNVDTLAVSSNSFIKYLTCTNNVDKSKLIYLPQHCTPIFLEKKHTNKPVFAFGGNIGSVQDIPCIIKACNEIKDLDFEVRIYGDGSEFNNCVKLTENMKLSNKVKFFGRVSHKDLISAYSDADAFLLTLSSIGEISNTVPAKLQEYMSAARPIFAAAGTGVKEIISKSGCGRSANSGDYKALSGFMKEFITQPEKFSNCGQAGYDYYINNFTLDVFIERLLKIFNNNL